MKEFCLSHALPYKTEQPYLSGRMLEDTAPPQCLGRDRRAVAARKRSHVPSNLKVCYLRLSVL